MVCAGDLYEGHPERGLAAVLALAGGRPVVLVPGNHEHYAPTGDERRAPELLAALAAEVERLNDGGARLHLLRHGASCVLDHFRFVGATLWSDWSLAGRWLAADAPDRPADPVAYAAARMTDPITGSREYRGSIRKDDGSAWLPADAMAAHASERGMLLAALAEPFAGPDGVGDAPPSQPTRGRRLPPTRRGCRGGCPPSTRRRSSTTSPTTHDPTCGYPATFMPGTTSRSGRCRWVANPVEGTTYAADRVVTLRQSPT